jgi:CheY-like chemotaxis protein
MLNQLARSKRILVVDDEATLVFFLKQDLAEALLPPETPAKHYVDIASSGEDALTKLTYNRYDLLITDLNMPGISGFTLVEVARSLYPDIKVILMTAFGSREVQEEAKNLDIDGYLTKPFPTVQLRDMARNILFADNNIPTA